MIRRHRRSDITVRLDSPIQRIAAVTGDDPVELAVALDDLAQTGMSAGDLWDFVGRNLVYGEPLLPVLRAELRVRTG